jgi:hypothetical protein
LRFTPSRAVMRYALVALAVVLLFAFVPDLLGGFAKTKGGQVAIVRNGGPFDDNKIQKILDPSSSRTWIGFGSEVHRYPVEQRVFIITTDPKRASSLGVDTLTISSNDGVNMGIEGAMYYSLNPDHATLREFDEKFGPHRFLGPDGGRRYPYAGEDGWRDFFGQMIRPIVDNSLRTQISGFRCEDLVPACAFLDSDPTRPKALITSEDSKANFVKIQEAIDNSLSQDLVETLGKPYLINFHFNLTRITLPAAVQDGIDKAQAKLAEVYGTLADVRKAKSDAAVDKARQDGYKACPTCAELEKSRPQQ